MANERILVVEHDPDISDVIARQTLQAMGYKVKVVGAAGDAVQQLVKFNPQLVITNLHLPDLSGKDLMVALRSQKNDVPVIIVAEEGQEAEVIQTFRLGASDYLLWPARDAEIVAVTDRALQRVREHNERQKLERQLKDANAKLQTRLREMTTLLKLGKMVVSTTDQRNLFDRILSGAMELAAADTGWLLTRAENGKEFLLAAHRNLPTGWARKEGKPLDDGVSGLVRVSGETLLMHGKALERFKVSTLGRAIAIVPIKTRRDVIGLLVVMRQKEHPFTENTQMLLEAVADYAAISLVNAHLFKALEETALRARKGEQVKQRMLDNLRRQIRDDIQSAIYPLELMDTGKLGELTKEQKEALGRARQALTQIVTLVNEATLRFGKG